MALTSDKKAQLQIFSGISLSKTQVETIIRRSLTDREWRAHNRDYKVIFSQVAQQASNVAARKFKVRNAKPSDENIKLLRIEKERKKYIPYFEDHKKVFQNIAVDAARKALVKKAKQLKDCDRPLQKQEAISQLSELRKQQFKNEQKLKKIQNRINSGIHFKKI